jgi:hypothetical protein
MKICIWHSLKSIGGAFNSKRQAHLSRHQTSEPGYCIVNQLSSILSIQVIAGVVFAASETPAVRRTIGRSWAITNVIPGFRQHSSPQNQALIQK